MAVSDNNLNFAISMEGLDEKGQVIIDQFKIIDDALTEIEEAKKKLDSWKSANKDLYENKINQALPKMHEMAKNVYAYGSIAQSTVENLREVERKIQEAMENNG